MQSVRVFGYYGEDGALMSVEFQREPALRIAEPVRLFGSEENELVEPDRGFDIARDGQSLLMVRRVQQGGTEPVIVIVQNWLAGF